MYLFFFLSVLFSFRAYALPTPSASALALDERDNFSITRNELAGPCKPVTVIFARGTSELGNVGTFAGPAFFNALTSLIGTSAVAVQGVDYGATILGYLEGGDPAGAATMASLSAQAASKCPSTQIVLSGYSQGAQVVHLAARQLAASVAARVKAVVLFGDPDDGQALANIPTGETVTFCFETDLICDGAPIVLPAHLSYSLDAPAAASFVAAHVQV